MDKILNKVRGHSYKSSIGKILDYNSNCDYLVNKIFPQQNFDCFIDVPCGNGTLLTQLLKRNLKTKLCGIDNSKEQLKIALNPGQIKYIQGNIFKISKLQKKVDSNNCFCHLGFSFFNVFDKNQRNAILIELLKSSFISTVGFEIQNLSYQSRFYESNTWYESILPDGSKLKSMSKKEINGKKTLYLSFNDKEIIKEELFDWEIDSCKSDCLNSGWEKIIVMPAEYREKREEINSHYFIILNR